ncbi:InlB B-repeat-containing protein, partial [Candidatus Saccharibacteria bacterium]|nr:InlB B-repeat-containing protein [Candidatus Saccharibacteria bacterium]
YPDDQDCTSAGGTLYQPGDTFGIDQTTVNIVDLYATWWQPNLTKLNGKKMQDMSPMACYNSSINDTATLTDSRGKVSPDSPESYTIAKLADGLCWMTTNLNLGKSNGSITLTPEDTDITTDFTLPASTTEFATSNTSVLPKVLTDSTYGGYYSYAAAIASTTSYTATNIIITSSICPKNWDLPSAAQYNNLKSKGNLTNFAAASAAPYNFIYAGYRNGTSFSGQANSIRLWTSTNYGSSYAYYSSAYNNASYSSNYKRYGESIRCVASSGTATVNYDGNGTTEYPTTGTTAAQENVEINSTVTRANGFTRTGWQFNGWNTAPDGSGIAIAANVASTTPLSSLNFAPGSTITLYAQWLPAYIITYVNNCYTFSTGCTSATSANTQTQYINLTSSPSAGTETGTLAAYSRFTQTGYKIKSWNTTATGDGVDYPVESIYTVPSGSILGDGITLYAQWVPVYSLIYNGNGADSSATDGVMTNVKHTNVAVGDWLDLFASNYSKAGYGFAGWSLTQVNTTSASDINSAVSAGTLKIYGPNEAFNPDSTFSTYADSNKNVTLYAVWVAPETGITMQTFNPTSATYSNMPNGSVIALRDSRDNDVYMVAKLADGNWWMGENLRLDDGATLTTSNTNNPLVDNGNVALKQTWYQDSSISITATTANHLSPSLPNKTTGNTYASFTGWCTEYNNANCVDQSMLNTWNKLHITNTSTTGYTNNYSPSATDIVTTATTQTSPSHTDLNYYPVYSYGNYYNWYSATAGNGTYSESPDNVTVTGDLCPTGWHLPYGNTGTSGTNIGGTSGGFSYLDTKLTSPDGSHGNGQPQDTSIASQRWRVFPNNFVYSGNWGSSSASSRGNRGQYWSSTSYMHHAYWLFLDSYNVYPGTYNFANKYYGCSIRCVAGV